ncbi:hypothetical protein [Cohnella silvisoli]|uniref:Uncharacterized protein n=1 Tax=Cohnella silvisoli TaxID=2873699 RepID=A0ABV1KPE3_9BACL|nr:hypothetical protein [Cohnella silvisoli]MCD9021205.1 hypothetical protein [Cohnella silvisoli]
MPIVQWRHWSVLLAVGIMVLLLLSQLPAMEHGLQQRRQAVAVFQPAKVKWLTDDNLVDALSKLPLQDQLTKVGWDHAILTIDLLGTVPDEVWEDMGQLIIFSYAEMHNVRQLLIRVFKDKGEQRTLLMAAETRKNEWTDKELTELRLSDLMVDVNSNSKIRLSVSPSGRRWLANFAN